MTDLLPQPAFYRELAATPRRLLAFWWLWAWRTIAGGALAGGVIGFIIGFAGTVSGVDRTTLSRVNVIAGVVVSVVWTFVVLRMAFRKTYGDFRIALVSAPLPLAERP